MNTILNQLRAYFKNTPRASIEADWNSLNKYEDIGPTINEFLYFMDKKIFKWEYKLEENTKIEKTSDFYSESFCFFAL